MKFIDESGIVWVMEKAKFGGVRIRVPECDADFDDPNENGYWYPNQVICLMDMEKCYGVLLPLDENE